MLQIIIKIIISSSIIVLVSEIAKKSTFIGGIIASIPIVSVLSLIWLYIETNNIDTVKSLANGILWMIIPSMALFITLPMMINWGINFYFSLLISIIVTIFFYGLIIFTLNYIGVKI